MLGPHKIKLSFMKLCKWTATSDLSHNSLKEINKIKHILACQNFSDIFLRSILNVKYIEFSQLLITNGNHKESIKYKQLLVPNGELLSENT